MVFQPGLRDKFVKLDPKDAKAYNNRGCTKEELGDHEGAILDYNKAIKLDPKYAIFYNNRGVTKKKLGDYEGACLDWSKAGELGDGDAYQLIREYCNSN